MFLIMSHVAVGVTELHILFPAFPRLLKDCKHYHRKFSTSYSTETAAFTKNELLIALHFQHLLVIAINTVLQMTVYSTL
jgi:hypothetical protein